VVILCNRRLAGTAEENATAAAIHANLDKKSLPIYESHVYSFAVSSLAAYPKWLRSHLTLTPKRIAVR
jgi:hypothetical protein